MELPPKDVRTVFSAVKVGELTGKPRALADEVIEELSEEHNISFNSRSSLLAVVNASKKLNKKSKRDAKLLKKMEKLVMTCSSSLKGGRGGEPGHGKGSTMEQIKSDIRKRAELGTGKQEPEGLAVSKTKLSSQNQKELNAKFLEAASKPYDPTETLKKLLEQGADINAKNKDGSTALMLVINGEQRYAIVLLLSEGADVNAKNNNGDTAMMIALRGGHKDLAEPFLFKGADVNAKNNDGWTALTIALENGYKDLAELFISKGADVNAKNIDGSTALMSASSQGYKDLAELFISKGADVNAKDIDGNTALMFASDRGHEDLAKFLLSKGADVNAKNNNGDTALMFASREDHNGTVKLLLSKGADVNAKNNDGWTAMTLLAYAQNYKIATLLKEAEEKT